MGVFMKRFLCVCMCIFILTISVLTYFPVYAADSDFTLSIDYNTVCNMHPSLSSSEAHSAVMNHGDIYGSDHKIVFQYTPTSSYNWSAVGSFSDIRMSDKQLETFLQCNNSLSTIGQLFKANAANNPIIRTLVSGLGAITTGDSDLLTGFYDKLTSNVNYLNAIEYDSSTGDLTLLADQVSALREMLIQQYSVSIGAVPLNIQNDAPQSLADKFKSYFEYQEDYISCYNNIVDYDVAFGINTYSSNFSYDEHLLGAFNMKDFNYVYMNDSSTSSWSGSYYPELVFVDSALNVSSLKCNIYFNEFGGNPDSLYFHCQSAGYYEASGYRVLANVMVRSKTHNYVNSLYVYSDKVDYIPVFKSYEALYNYVHGSQTAYLSSKVEQAGEDIKLSINDMNDNIGSKIDDLIDSINNKKEGMSADELQKAIDDALASISGKLDDIGDNTQQTNNKLDALLESVSGTNQILMQILGVTTDIRDIVKTKDQEGNQYTMSDVKNCFNTMFNNLKYSILYGKNVTNNPDAANVSTAAYVSYSDVSTYADTSAETLDYKDGLFGKFPFSVPYQMYEWLQVLQVDEKVPQFTYNYGFLIGQKGKQEYDLTFNLSAYQSWADVIKSFLRLSFTLIMSVFIYIKFKGEM